MTFSLILVAGGMGTRLGRSEPKAFVPLGGSPLFLHSLKTFDSSGHICEAIIVVPKGFEEETAEICRASGVETSVKVVAGGPDRWISVKNGVAQASGDYVVIHDAARPFVTTALIKEMCLAMSDLTALITANPVTDTVRTFKGDLCGETVDRSSLIAVGTPQIFSRETLTSAYEKAVDLPVTPTDEAMLLESLNIPVNFQLGDPRNFKVTTPGDFMIAEALIEKYS